MLKSKRILDQTMQNEHVQDALSATIRNITQKNMNLSNPRHVLLKQRLEAVAHKAIRVILKARLPRPNIKTNNWKQQLADNVEAVLLKTQLFAERETVKRSLIAEFGNTIKLPGVITLFLGGKVMAYATYVAVMVSHDLDPELLVLSPNEANAELLELATAR